ncbi:MAG TPA: cysteine--tRNA ligase [Nitrospirota bacterium]
MKIYNTLSGKKEEFVTVRPNEVGMYACGVTVYDHSHIGHARGAVVFDVARKYLQHKGYKVKYARNFTDVDDKIIKRANELGVSWKDIAEKYTQEYINDMNKLGVDRPDIEPKATEHIPEIIGMVKTLADKGYAYESGGDVFYSVRKFTGYGKLSKKPIDEMESGSRVDVDERKKDPLDFVLWKASKPGEPAWESPWGPGRPGWHIECSAMSVKHIGETLDIHAGGMDLQFPHHENEIAQAEAATGKPFVKFWMHNGFVNVNREKMSKSLGNFFTIKEIMEKYDPEVIRFFLLSTHYRSPIDFSDQSLQDTKAGLARYYTMAEGLKGALAGYQPKPYKAGELSKPASDLDSSVRSFREKFDEVMDDDFNTAGAIGAVFELVREVNKVTADQELLKDDPAIKAVLAEADKAFREAGHILTLFKRDPDEWFGRVGTERRSGLTNEQIEGLILDRANARASRDWKRADEIRNQLSEAGVELLDGSEGTKWQIRE